MDNKWLNAFLSIRDLWPNRTGQGPVKAGAPLFGGRHGYSEKKDLQAKNLGLGWAYYAFARLYKPKITVGIGSGRGFAPLLFAKGIKDNANNGKYYFIDPSLDDGFWKDSKKNKKLFKKFGVEKAIKHYLLTTQEFVKTKEYKRLRNIELLCIDGSHFYNFVKFDFKVFEKKLRKDAIILFHDSISRSKNPEWNGPRKFLCELLKNKNYQSFDFKFGAGLTIVQKRFFEQTGDYLNFLERNWKDKNDKSF